MFKDVYILNKISGISLDQLSGTQKIELPKLERVSPHIKRERNMGQRNTELSEKKDYTKEDVQKAVDTTNKLLSVEQRDMHFKFQVHEGTDRIMVKLIDNKTKEVIKEIPSEKILDLIANIWERLGILVDERG